MYDPANPAISKFAPGPGYDVKSFITINLPEGITSANPLPATVTVVLRVRYPRPRLIQLVLPITLSAVLTSIRASELLLGSINVQVGPSVYPEPTSHSFTERMIPELMVTRPKARAPVCILLNLSVLSMAIHIGVLLPTVESLAST